MLTCLSLVLQLELSGLQLVHSLWAGNFEQSVQTLTSFMPLFLAMDHVHYTQQLSVHLHDLCQLIRKHPSGPQAFCHGAFVINRTQGPFSAVAFDHAHEQCICMAEGDGGAVGLTANPVALCRWMIAGSEIARQSLCNCERQALHSELAEPCDQLTAVLKAFKRDVQLLVTHCL